MKENVFFGLLKEKKRKLLKSMNINNKKIIPNEEQLMYLYEHLLNFYFHQIENKDEFSLFEQKAQKMDWKKIDVLSEKLNNEWPFDGFFLKPEIFFQDLSVSAKSTLKRIVLNFHKELINSDVFIVGRGPLIEKIDLYHLILLQDVGLENKTEEWVSVHNNPLSKRWLKTRNTSDTIKMLKAA